MPAAWSTPSVLSADQIAVHPGQVFSTSALMRRGMYRPSLSSAHVTCFVAMSIRSIPSISVDFTHSYSESPRETIARTLFKVFSKPLIAMSCPMVWAAQ